MPPPKEREAEEGEIPIPWKISLNVSSTFMILTGKGPLETSGIPGRKGFSVSASVPGMLQNAFPGLTGKPRFKA